MKFKMLVVCLLVGMGLLYFPKTYTYAAEETIVTQENVTNTQNTVIDQVNLLGKNILATANTNNEVEITPTVMPTETQEDALQSDSTIGDTQVDAEAEEIIEEVVDDDSEENKADEEDKKESKKEDKKKTKKVKYSKSDLRLLSALIYCEAGGESYQGKLAVGIVVMNRKRSGAYPDSVKGVIYQKYQFGPVTNGALDRALAEYDKGNFTSDMEKDCIKAAKAALSGTKSITVNGSKKDFSKYLYFSCNLRNSTFRLGNHEFK